MIEFDKEVLDNGLTVIVHKDAQASMVAVNTLYKVGARDESPDKTGFAHLFEHLMFGGSVHVPDFDTPLQRAGGQNNAFTNNDLTNYYVTIPKENLETALWLESDRMLNLAFSEKGLEVQRKVVIEEFRQRYLNQPYGDLWLELRPMAYKVHPYRWATIGKNIRHIERATMEDVKSFYQKYYNPSNAILSLAGNLEIPKIMDMVKKWYEEIPEGGSIKRAYPNEPFSNKGDVKFLERAVPQNAIHLAWLMPDRKDETYHAHDLLSDVLSNGKSSRFYRKLVKEREIFTRLSAFITGSIDRGLFVISGMLSNDVEPDYAREALLYELQSIAKDGVSQGELEKVRNKVVAQKAYQNSDNLNKAMNLAYHEFLDNAAEINTEKDKYLKVNRERITLVADNLLHNRGLFELQYHKTNG